MNAQLPSDIEMHIRRRIADINMLPTIATQALDIAKDPGCSVDKFSQVVERDVKLATEVLALSNSVMYSPGAPICSLHQAVMRLGFRQCKNLIVTSSLKACMSQITLSEEWIREVLWRHSFTTAMISLYINRALNIGFQGEEFTAGLIHDFGRTLFAISLPDQFCEIDTFEFDESAATLEHERGIVGTDHCEVGAWFAIANKLPEALVDTIRFHHKPESATRNGRLVALTAVADHMANHHQRFDEWEGYDVSTNEAVRLLEKSGVPHATERLTEIGRQILESSVADAAEMMC
jgi:HD-like signal output (HDOD) protein